MKVIRNVDDMQLVADRLRQEGKTVGFVPTMGFLHEGHLSLIRIARENADIVIVSIFVNPTQFGPDEDLDRYPRDFDRDQKLADAEGTDILFYPPIESLYPENYLTFVNVEKVTETLCGASRPNHFRGVVTICIKLFHLVKPHFAVFGQKDFQQAVVIKQMVKDLNIDLEIKTGPIIREEDGLAMSSRNLYLTPEEREDARVLYQSLIMAKKSIEKGEKKTGVIREQMRAMIKEKKNTRIDYIGIVTPDLLEDVDMIEDEVLVALAVFVGNTRLIDNMLIPASIQ